MDQTINKKIILYSLLALILASVFAIAATISDDESLFDNHDEDLSINTFLDTSSNKLGLLIPAILLVVTIVMFAIDFGAVGVGITSALSLVILYKLGIIYINVISLSGFIIIIAIVLYKISR